MLSNRADLISGGNALVEIKLPDKAKAKPADVRVDVNGVDVTGAFAVRADGRFYGLVSGLAQGANRSQSSDRRTPEDSCKEGHEVRSRR